MIEMLIGIALFILIVNAIIIALIAKKEIPEVENRYREIKKISIKEAKRYKATTIKELLKKIPIWVLFIMFVIIYLGLRDNNII